MSDIVTERTGGILRVELNRPDKKNAMTAAMYTSLADSFRAAADDEAVRVVLWHGAGDAFCAGNDVGDFLKNPPGPGESPQARLMNALIDFDKPIVAAVQGAAIGGGTTMLTHCDFVYAGESANFQLPARMGQIRAAELILLGEPFAAARAAEVGLVTRVVPDRYELATATATAQKLAAKPIGALRACKRLMKQAFIGQIKAAVKIENREFSERVRSAEAKEALSAFLEKRPPNFTKTTTPVAAE